MSPDSLARQPAPASQAGEKRDAQRAPGARTDGRRAPVARPSSGGQNPATLRIGHAGVHRIRHGRRQARLDRRAMTSWAALWPGRAHHAAARPGARSAEVEPPDRTLVGGRAGHRPQVECLLRHELPVEDVAAREPEARLEVRAGPAPGGRSPSRARSARTGQAPPAPGRRSRRAASSQVPSASRYGKYWVKIDSVWRAGGRDRCRRRPTGGERSGMAGRPAARRGPRRTRAACSRSWAR